MTTKLGKLGPYICPTRPADVFPLLEAEELKELAEDIKLNGLKDPVVLNHDGFGADRRPQSTARVRDRQCRDHREEARGALHRSRSSTTSSARTSADAS